MKNRILLFTAIFLFLCTIVRAQETQQKAEDIINKSRAAVFNQSSEIKNGYLEFSAVYKKSKEKAGRNTVNDYSYHSDFWLEFPDKIRLKKLVKYATNDTSEDTTLNGDNLSQNMLIGFDGEFSETAITKSGDSQKIKEESISKLKYDAFTTFFPVLLNFGDKLKFNFAGVAKAGEQKADVIETRTANNCKFTLFFDQKTNLLLMMKAQYFGENAKATVEQNFFFSDYRQEKGLTFAHKVVIQENGEVVEERQIKIVSINSIFKPAFFDVKK